MKLKGIFFIEIILCLLLVGCSLFLTGDASSKIETIKFTSLKLQKTTINLGVGGMEYIVLNSSPTNATEKITYSCNVPGIIDVDGDRNGVSITGLKSGNTILKATSDSGLSTACVVSVTGVDPTVEKSPQITSSTIALELEKGMSKKVQVSLTNATASDMSSFQWSIDKSAVATIEGSGQTAYITAKSDGIAQVTVSHPLAKYPYQFCVFVKPAEEPAVYITNNQNIITIDRNSGDKSIFVDLINGTETENAFFTWSILDNEFSDSKCISIAANGKNCVITPLKAGTAEIQVSHPRASYPYIIRCKVVTIVENIIIEPSENKVTLEGTFPKTITATLTGGEENFNPIEFEWTTDNPNLLELSPFQDSCGIQALGNGTAKVIVSHPAAKYPREILVFVKNHPAGSVDGAMYITTGQNYIRTKVGAKETLLTVSLVGGVEGDEKDFVWTVDNSDVIDIATTHGTVNNRAAYYTRQDGQAIITPKAEGTAIISVSHPKEVVPTEIMVCVLPETAILEAPLYITSTSAYGLVVGESAELSVSLTGNVSTGDEDNLIWKNENNNIINLSAANGTKAIITATDVGESYIFVSHPKADVPKKILVYTAATIEELAAKKIIYTSKNRYNIVAGGDTERLFVSVRGFAEEDISDISWSNSNPSVVEINIGNDNTECVIKGIAAGKSTIIASHPLCNKPVEFEITVLPAGTDLGVVPSPTYFTTGLNVVQFTSVNTSKTVSITPIQLPVEKYSEISWIVEDESICSVIPNGEKATITSLAEGTTKIKVSHPDSENELFITVRVGSQYISPEIIVPYVDASQDVLGLVNGGSGQKITAVLKNTSDSSGSFNWNIDDTDIATITPLGESCFIVPKNPGQAMLTISHKNAPGMDKQVLILVANSEEELAGLPYVTTSQNLVSLRKGSQQNIQVRIVNIDNPLPSGYVWTVVDNPSVVQVISNGSQAILKAMNTGIAHIEVTHADCKYPLQITVEVRDDLADAALNPYITSSQNIITLTSGGTSKSINVTLAGGNTEDNVDFTWSLDRADVISMVANGQNAMIKGLSAGECLIMVTHPKARYSFPIKVVVSEPVAGTSLYIKTTPANIITMKPADPEQTVTASLVGGTSEDAYGFKWYADNYNVIDLTATANTAVITPKSEGKATITIEHPKSGFPCEITVRITEYSTFEFGMTNITMTEGNTQFVSMKVPAIEAEYGGRVTYTTDNEKIVTISGTNKVAQLTAVNSGTAIVTATSPSGAKSQMMVYVQKAATKTEPYITSNTNVLSMKVTDNQRSISAQLIGEGVIATDQYNLKWEIEDTSVAKLVGTSGSSILVQPVGPGETTLKISHEKTNSVFSMYIQVTGAANGISLNKSYVALETGKTVELMATIDNGTATDYNAITWSADKVNGQEIVSILGSGKTVAVYGLASGQTSLTAEWNGNIVKCDILVEASRQFAFDTQTMRVQPGQTKTFKYTLVPDDAEIQWFTSTNDYMTYSVDPATKTISVTGISENPSGGVAMTTLSGISQSMKASISITTAWDYKLNIGKTMIKAEPRYDAQNPDKFVIPYEVNPANARIDVQISKDIADVYVDTSKQQIILTPRGEGDAVLSVTAYNVNVSPNVAFPNMTRTCNLYFSYDNLTVIPSVITQNGSFSRFDEDTGILILGDGESIELGFGIEEPNVQWQLESANIVHKDSASPVVCLAGSLGSGKSVVVQHPNDVITNQYRITEGYKPVYKDFFRETVSCKEYYELGYSCTCSDSDDDGWGDSSHFVEELKGTYDIALSDFYWNGCSDHQSPDLWNGFTEVYWDVWGLLSKSYSTLDKSKYDNNSNMGKWSGAKWVWWKDDDGGSYYGGYWDRRRDSSLDGKILTQKEFEATPWYYCPGVKEFGTSATVTTEARIMIENISAVKELCEDTAPQSSNHTDNLVIVYSNTVTGKRYTVTIPIYTEVRNCVYNYN